MACESRSWGASLTWSSAWSRARKRGDSRSHACDPKPRLRAKWRRCRDLNPGSVARRQFSKLLPGLAEIAYKWLQNQGVSAEDADALTGDLCTSLVPEPEIERLTGAWPRLSPEIRAAILSLVQVGDAGPSKATGEANGRAPEAR